ncbi:MAG: hypothetical protein OXI60_11235 [Acidiferrobacterales bacterium]|nr:hypothetical protein [Acidiferrobacterales bacterium]
MPATDDITTPKQNRISTRTLLLTAILLVVVLAGGVWLARMYTIDDLAGMVTDSSTWLDDPLDSRDDSADPVQLNQRYQQLHADLQAALNSDQSEKLRNFGRAKFREQVALGLIRAQDAFNAGDVDDALRHLELSAEHWRQAVSEIDAMSSGSGTVQQIQAGLSDRQTDGVSDDSSKSASEQNRMDEGGDLSLDHDQPGEVSIANVILSIPIGEQRSDGDLAQGNRQSVELPISDAEPEFTDGSNIADSAEVSDREVSALSPQTNFETEGSQPSETEHQRDTAPDNENLARLEYEFLMSELNRVLPTVQENQNLVPQNKSIIETAQQNFTKAKDAYRVQRFSDAKRFAVIALADANKAVEHEERHYHLSLAAAKDAYADRNVEIAAQAIDRAVALRPNSHEAAHWHDQIESLPNLIEAQQDADSARDSGQLHKEVEALERVVLYSNDTDWTEQRIAELKQLISDRQFFSTISRGLTALSDGNIEQARTELSNARNQRPSSSETARLQSGIEHAERQHRISELLEAATRAWEQDNWNNALVHYQKVLSIDPDRDEAVQGREFATRIIALQSAMDDFLNRPHRLSSPNIAASANSAVESAAPLGVFSRRLELTANSLADAILEWQTPVLVRVLSDGKTEIGIRGVGRIGRTKEKSITLRPGTYVFEGRREGYRSTLIEIVVASSEIAQEITVICSERS